MTLRLEFSLKMYQRYIRDIYGSVIPRKLCRVRPVYPHFPNSYYVIISPQLKSLQPIHVAYITRVFFIYIKKKIKICFLPLVLYTHLSQTKHKYMCMCMYIFIYICICVYVGFVLLISLKAIQDATSVPSCFIYAVLITV